MRWFASFWITVLATAAAAGLLALRAADVPVVSDALRWMIPVARVPWFMQAALIFGCWTATRIALQWAIAYTESATDASPRARPGKRARLVIVNVCPASAWVPAVLGRFKARASKGAVNSATGRVSPDQTVI